MIALDIYFDPIHNVLKNKLNIKDAEELEKIEYIFTGYRLAQLSQKDVNPILSMDDYKEIHKFLFQDIYDWAGKYRTVDIHKGNTSFLPYKYINRAEEQINESIKSFLTNPNRSSEFVCKQLAKILCDLNYMHPFREGNGRTQREFIRQLAAIKGYDLYISPENNLYMEACINDDEKLMYKAIKKGIKEMREKINNRNNKNELER